jgi:hypothetical protein
MPYRAGHKKDLSEMTARINFYKQQAAIFGNSHAVYSTSPINNRLQLHDPL